MSQTWRVRNLITKEVTEVESYDQAIAMGIEIIIRRGVETCQELDKQWEIVEQFQKNAGIEKNSSGQKEIFGVKDYVLVEKVH